MTAPTLYLEENGQILTKYSMMIRSKSEERGRPPLDLKSVTTSVSLAGRADTLVRRSHEP